MDARAWAYLAELWRDAQGMTWQGWLFLAIAAPLEVWCIWRAYCWGYDHTDRLCQWLDERIGRWLV